VHAGGSKGLEQFIDIIAAGIALPEPSFVANAIFSMAHVIQCFPNQLSSDYYFNLIDTALLLLKHNKYVYFVTLVYQTHEIVLKWLPPTLK
jgi:hypothetical protein